ncbi:hypothetical protein [Ramlibacter sp. WS9]|uniref:hypothetical protein n=1 Tax=Ramlibacter sp. WS9 TaxID=1882741 RepID=UPI0011445F46|nr:hypothetical protein [Ramlibacter sp. WS9]ROZ77052.1 hypothetical protein EEB15_10760 [Ramlibacter sp. WS9]
MAYSNVQFIGYVLDTAPASNPDGSRTYLGLSNPQLDIEARCDLMQRAMQAARDAVSRQSPPPPADTLKVFMAPAGFFCGSTGAYQPDDVEKLLTALQRVASDPQWLDWVFVFGTVAGVSPSSAEADYSFVLVQQGGVALQANTGLRLVMKELASGVDSTASAAGPGGVLVGSAPEAQQQQAAYDGAGMFELAGLTWEVESREGSDDAPDRLPKPPQLPGKKLIQLQLVPSRGVDMADWHVITQPGGYVFHCDGFGAASRSTLTQQVPPPVNIPAASSIPVGDASIALQSTSPATQVAISTLCPGGPGMVNIYPASALPVQQTAPGTTVRLVWQASADYQFIFLLVYSDSGNFATLLCEIRSRKTDFHGNNYYLPLSLQTQDSLAQDVRIQMQLRPGSAPYAGAVWCKINVPGFVFQGNAFEFSANASGLPPLTVW